MHQRWYLISGNTFPQRTQLRALGGQRYDGDDLPLRGWLFRDVHTAIEAYRLVGAGRAHVVCSTERYKSKFGTMCDRLTLGADISAQCKAEQTS